MAELVHFRTPFITTKKNDVPKKIYTIQGKM